MAVILPIISKFDASGIHKAKGAFGKLRVAALGVGAAMAAAGVAAAKFGIDATKAATEDLKSQKLLAGQMQKNAKATQAQIKNTEEFISKLAMQTGIMDDDLRPAMAKLVRGTGSVKKAQDLLTLALDASAATGKPLATVSDALTKAFNGNTTSLTRMFPNLKKSKDLMRDLKKMVGGTAKEVATPWERINVAFQEMKERIGSALLPYVQKLADYLMGFFDKLNDPKSAEAKAFDGIMTGIKETMDTFGNFLGMFDTSGKGNPVVGFMNVMETGLLNISNIMDTITVGYLTAKDIVGSLSKGERNILEAASTRVGITLGGGGFKEISKAMADRRFGQSAAKNMYDIPKVTNNPSAFGAPVYTRDRVTGKVTKQEIKIDVKVGAGVSGDAVGREIVRRIKEYEKSNGSGWRRGSL